MDAGSMREATTLVKRHPFAVNTVAWSPDGQRIASAGDDGVVQVWELESSRMRAWRPGDAESAAR
jgi:WD40 repeat protein